MSHVYLCSVCHQKSTHPADEPDPVCNSTSRCGLLFPEERLVAPVARSLKFELIGDGYMPGDERPYDVIQRGRVIGVVERSWLVAAQPGGEPPLGWGFRSNDGKLHGEGHSRAAAVINAYGGTS